MFKPLFCVLMFAGLLTTPGLKPDKKIITPNGLKPGTNWSYGVMTDGTLYVSGMGAEDANGKVPPTFEGEVQQSLDNIDAVLKAAGMTRADVVSVQVYITDRDSFEKMNKVYTSFFKDPRPARTTVIVAGLVGDGHVEITATARK